MSERVVTHPLKADLHIHSAASRHKDGEKVANNTIDNIDVLIEKLEENGVNLAAISDHDVFDVALYRAFVEKAKGSTVVKKVLPAVEFSVNFNTQGEPKVVHIVTVFNDSDPMAIDKISTAIPMNGDDPAYDCDSSFSESGFWGIIKTIGLDVVLIAHQKNSLTSSKPRKNDANVVGEERFNEFLFVDYFEAYEYKNERNELFNKQYNYSADEIAQIRFVTGSDCHVWSCYPHYDENDTDIVHPTYLKCLPSFRGLALAVTDISRIKAIDSFFTTSDKVLDSISMTINGSRIEIPLSRGINAIIGDNSIGKSLLANALTGFRKIPQKTKDGYQKYLDRIGVTIDSSIPADSYFQFDEQGSIRKLFESIRDGHTKASDHLSVHFPNSIDPGRYFEFGKTEIGLFCQAVRASCDYQDSVRAFPTFIIPVGQMDKPAESINFRNSVSINDASGNKALIDDIQAIDARIDGLQELHVSVVTQKDLEDICVARDALKRVTERHGAIVLKAELDKKIANAIKTQVGKKKSELASYVTDRQRKLDSFDAEKVSAISAIVKAVQMHSKVRDHTFDFDALDIEPNVNPVGNLRFISRLKVSELSPSILYSILRSVLRSGQTIDVETVSRSNLKDAIKNYPGESGLDPVDVLAERLEEGLAERLKGENAIIRDEDDVSSELSQGFNAQIYFQLLADTSGNEGVYLVDQPEDQISQSAIHETVLGEFRAIGNSRQVILITHNPQFIVNLDVDNVICLLKCGDSISVKHGALEYECEEYSMLNVVADNIEGGLETIKRRMKRYEKAN